jgi:hypothetical protein
MALPVREYLLDTLEYVLDTLIGYSVFALHVREYLLDTDPAEAAKWVAHFRCTSKSRYIAAQLSRKASRTSCSLSRQRYLHKTVNTCL